MEKADLAWIWKKIKTAHLQWVSWGQYYPDTNPRTIFSLSCVFALFLWTVWEALVILVDKLKLKRCWMTLRWLQHDWAQDPLNPCLPFSLLFHTSIFVAMSVKGEYIFLPEEARMQNNACFEKCRLCVIMSITSHCQNQHGTWVWRSLRWLWMECRQVQQGAFPTISSCHLASKALLLFPKVKNKFWY